MSGNINLALQISLLLSNFERGLHNIRPAKSIHSKSSLKLKLFLPRQRQHKMNQRREKFR